MSDDVSHSENGDVRGNGPRHRGASRGQSHTAEPHWPLRLSFAALAMSIVAALFIAHVNEQPELSKRTQASGMPLTAEQKSVDFQKADLSFEVLPDRREIRGRAILDFAVKAPISRIQFDLDEGLPIESIAADGAPLDRSAWHNRSGLVTVDLPRPKAADEQLELAIEYGGKPHVAKNAPWDGGFVWSHTPAGQPWIATAVQGEGCDLLWPCFDNPLVEVGTVDLHINVPKGLVAAANGRLLSVTSQSDGRSTYNWRSHRPNSYSIALNIGPYRELSAVYSSRYGNRIPLKFWYLPGDDKKARALFAEFRPTLDFFESTIGPYPFGNEKVAAVVTPHLGMEHQTINAYGNDYKPAPEGYDWLMSHEFSHEWFGNQLTNSSWDDMWLHEGFGTYMQPLFLKWRDGQMAYDAAMFKHRQSIANKFPIVSGKPRIEKEVYNEKTGPATDIYYKGAWILHTLRNLIGDEAFFSATRRLVYGRPDPRPGNFLPRFADTNEFVRLASEEAGRDLGWFFNVYLRRAKLPMLTSRRDRSSLSLQWYSPGGLAFPMPIEVLVDGRLQIVPMTGGRGTVSLPSPNSHWVIDPGSKILRQSDAIDRFRAWDAAQKAKKNPKGSA